MGYPQLKNTVSIRPHLARELSFEKLNQDEEYTLIDEWQKKANKHALMRLIESHQKLLQKIARGYSKYGIRMEDLISEGYVGIIQAANNFKPEHGFRFSTYITRCVKNFLQRFVMKLSSVVSIKPDNDNRKIFFQLKRVKNEVNENSAMSSSNDISDEDLKKIEKSLQVSKDKIKALNERIYSGDVSLNQKVTNDNESVEFQDFIKDPVDIEKEIIEKNETAKKSKLLKEALEILSPKEHKIFCARRLADEPKTLSELAYELGISAERVRQIEHDAFLKVTKHIKMLFYNDGRICHICFFIV